MSKLTERREVATLDLNAPPRLFFEPDDEITIPAGICEFARFAHERFARRYSTAQVTMIALLEEQIAHDAEIAALKQQLAEVKADIETFWKREHTEAVEWAEREADRAETAEAANKRLRAETIEECIAVVRNLGAVPPPGHILERLAWEPPSRGKYIDALRALASETAGEQQT